MTPADDPTPTAEHSIDDVTFDVTPVLPPDAMPVDVRDDVVWLPDGLTLTVDLPDGVSIVASVGLRHLVQWYGLVVSGKSGLLPHASGYWYATSNDGLVILDLSSCVIESDGRERIVESGPRIAGSSGTVIAELATVIDEVFDALERRGVDGDEVVADLVDVVDDVDREMLEGVRHGD